MAKKSRVIPAARQGANTTEGPKAKPINPFAQKKQNKANHLKTVTNKANERRRGQTVGGIKRKELDEISKSKLLAEKMLKSEQERVRKTKRGKKRFELDDSDSVVEDLILSTGKKVCSLDKSQMKELGRKLSFNRSDEDSEDDAKFAETATSPNLDGLTKKERLKVMMKKTREDKEKRKEERSEVARLVDDMDAQYDSILSLMKTGDMMEQTKADLAEARERRYAEILAKEEETHIHDHHHHSADKSDECGDGSGDESGDGSGDESVAGGEVQASDEKTTDSSEDDVQMEASGIAGADDPNVRMTDINNVDAEDLVYSDEGDDEDFSDDDVEGGDAESDNAFAVPEHPLPTEIPAVHNLDAATESDILDFWMHANEAIDLWSCHRMQSYSLPLPPTIHNVSEARVAGVSSTKELLKIQFGLWTVIDSFWKRTASKSDEIFNGVWSIESINFGLMIMYTVSHLLKDHDNDWDLVSTFNTIMNSTVCHLDHLLSKCTESRPTESAYFAPGPRKIVSPRSEEQLNDESSYDTTVTGALKRYLEIVFCPMVDAINRNINNHRFSEKRCNMIEGEIGVMIQRLFDAAASDQLDTTHLKLRDLEDPRYTNLVPKIIPEFSKIRTRTAIKQMTAEGRGLSGVDALIENQKEKDLKRARRAQARMLRRDAEAEANAAALARSRRLAVRGREQAALDKFIQQDKATIAQISTGQAQSGDTSMGVHRAMKDARKKRKLGPNSAKETTNK